jgi:hypothetical protein
MSLLICCFCYAGRTCHYFCRLNSLIIKHLLRNRPVANFDIAALYKFAANALQNLQILWEKSSFEKKKIFQVFGFPKGVVFDGEKFRTPEICSIFKLKELIDGNLLPVVPHQRLGRSDSKQCKPFQEKNQLLD